MNTTIAKVIAFELGILIAILGWMAFPHRPAEKIAQVPRMENPSASDSFATVSRLYAANPQAPGVDYLAEEEAAPPADNAEPAQSMIYDQSAPAQEPAVDYGANSYGANGYAVPPDPSTYIGTFPEPVLGPDYYDFYGYYPYSYGQPTQIIVFSNSRSFGGRRHFASMRGGQGRRMAPPRRHFQPAERLSPQRPRVGRPGAMVQRPRVVRPGPVMRRPVFNQGPILHVGNRGGGLMQPVANGQTRNLGAPGNRPLRHR